ncbi:lanthionine synthetase LanC family protein [uncultured Microscilla sp.]|uniref:lanthionine synthetase LanC family protein n=1 Tax=uncultured Microscilla sp. TaxID=432653 RepID=UPI00261B8672|nr:lanthionine synthetase LanC family protein [uncultured Microscilla sp.]
MNYLIPEITRNIADNLLSCQEKSENTGDIFSGKAGVILFLANYYHIEKRNCYVNTIFELLNSTLNNLQNEKSGSMSGVAGIGWILQYLVNIGILDKKEVYPYLQQINTAVVSSLNQDFDAGYYDLMHGYIGKLIFLMDSNEYSKKTSNVVKFVEESIHFFQQTSIRDCPQKIFWKQTNFGDISFESKACLGMAHGIPSIISFLSLLLEENYLTNDKKKEARILIEQSCEWILDKEGKYEVKNGLFPTFIPPNEANLDSFLAWCYGDLGIAISFIRAGKVLSNKRLYKEGIRIATHAAQRQLKNSGISHDLSRSDITLCHGSFGILYQFHLLYKKTRVQAFKMAREYWLGISLSNISIDEPFCNLKSCISSRKSKAKEWETLYSLLGGVSGVGLVLSSIYSHQGSTSQDWARILLLDF